MKRESSSTLSATDNEQHSQPQVEESLKPGSLFDFSGGKNEDLSLGVIAAESNPETILSAPEPLVLDAYFVERTEVNNPYIDSLAASLNNTSCLNGDDNVVNSESVSEESSLQSSSASSTTSSQSGPRLTRVQRPTQTELETYFSEKRAESERKTGVTKTEYRMFDKQDPQRDVLHPAIINVTFPESAIPTKK